MNIRIVTDSTSDLPREMAEAHGVTVLPAYVNIGNDSYLDGVELSRQEFYKQLPHYENPPTTAAPAVGAFSAAYEKLAREGATHIVSVHVASSLSGILNAARLGAEAVEGVEVTVFDSRQITMGLGFLALLAARSAQDGHSIAEILAGLERAVPRTHVFAALDTLEFLRRSGRVSWAEFGLGTLLRVKPMVHVYDGAVGSLERVRTMSRALKHLLQHVRDLGELQEVALLHTAAPEAVKQLRRDAAAVFPPSYDPVAVEVTPTIGAHVGPGALGFACVVCES